MLKNFNEWVASKIEGDHTRRENFVGYVDMTAPEFTTFLLNRGFETCQSQFAKEFESLRLVDDEQIHVFLYRGHPDRESELGEKCYVFAHSEPTWEKLRKYILSDSNGPRAVNKIRTLCNKHGVQYNDDIAIRD